MEEQNIEIESNGDIALGIYSNLALISHNENEFVMDFIFAHPPKGQLGARVIMSPSHAKRFLKALSENIAIYEKKAGPIKEAPEPPKFGFKFSSN